MSPRLQGKLRGTWQYEVGGGERIWYRRGEGKYEDQPIVTHAGSAPSKTH